MKNTFYFFASLAIIFFVLKADRGNVDQRKESVNVTWCDTVNVASINYTDAKGGFRIKNLSSDTIYLKVVMIAANSDTLRWGFTQGWNPEVIKTIVTDASNSDSIIYIGK